MKKILIITLLFVSTITFSQTPIWTVGTARTIPKGEIDFSLFYFTKYGLTSYLELQGKPLFWFKLPQLNAKVTWYYHKGQKHKNYLKSRNFLIGSIHGVNYPTWALKYFRNKGLRNGLIPSDAIIPSFFAFRNELLLTVIIKRRKTCSEKNFLLTFKIGNKLALRTGETTLPYFENSLYYRESSIYHKKLLWYFGLDLDAKLFPWLNYTIDVDIFSIGNNTDYWAMEHKGLLYWLMGKQERIRMAVGYKVAYANYPTTNVSYTALLDFTFMFRPKNNDHSQLFQKGVYDESDVFHH